jgi:hypothetical protein
MAVVEGSTPLGTCKADGCKTGDVLVPQLYPAPAGSYSLVLS